MASLLTIDELKKELTKSGVPLPSGRPKKEEYVKLYEENIALNASIADTYSSDEENSQSSRKVTSTNSMNHSQNIPEAVENLSDDELFDKLKDFGYSVGPVVPNTRQVYVKKLIQILQGGGNASYNGVNSAVHINSSEISDNEVEIQAEPAVKRSARLSSHRESPRPGPSKREVSPPTSEPAKTETHPVSRVSFIEKVKRRSPAIGDDAEQYAGRWSPSVSLARMKIPEPAKFQAKSTSRKNGILFFAGVLVILAALIAMGYYQWTVNDPYQQLQEDAENEVKKLAARKAEN